MDVAFNYPIKPVIRNLMLCIWNGDAKLEDFGPAMHYLDCHFPVDKLEPALAWLVRNNIRGKRFDDFLKEDCAGSYLEMHRQLLKRIERSRDERRIIAGVDFK